MDEAQKSAEVREKAKRPWSLRKKLGLAAIVLVIIIGLAVGLGVGLTRGHGDGGSSSDSDSDSDSSPDKASPFSHRTTTWKPKVKDTWQIVLSQPIKLSGSCVTPDVDIYDLDMFENAAKTFTTLQRSGKKVICYFSAGSWENWRADKNEFHKSDLGKPLDGWPGERWLNVSSRNVRRIMAKRIEFAAQKGCDAIDPDNVDGYQNKNGLGLTKADAVDYVKFLSAQAAKHKMSTGLKNAGGVIHDVLDVVAFSVNEQCVQYDECKTFAAFVAAGKPVFHIEYPKGAPSVSPGALSDICSGTGKAEGTKGFSTVLKKMNLGGWVEYCDGKKYTTPIQN